jgi:hypothetical protein
MPVRSAQDHLEATAPWSASTSPSPVRSHRPVKSRRAHRAAHAAARSETHRIMVLSSLALLIPMAAAVTILELVR